MKMKYILFGVFLIAIFIAFLIPNILTKSDTKTELAKEEIKYLTKKLVEFKNMNGRFPTNSEGLSILVPNFVSAIPVDPWGEEYQYFFANGEVEITSKVDRD